MRIAFISYEFPPDTANGGIATYVRQAARMLVLRGHDVSVFTASKRGPGVRESLDGIKVFREPTPTRQAFAQHIEPAFTTEHERKPFDVIEGPDFMADAREIARRHPRLPFVLKLHTCSQILREIGFDMPASVAAKGWVKAGLTFRKPWWQRIPIEAAERLHAQDADVIAAPSASIGERTIDTWGLDQKIELLPNPFEVNKAFLAVPEQSDTRRILYVGRLERRKGVLELAKAMKRVHRKHPGWTLRFVGEAKEPLRSLVVKSAGSAGGAIEFFGKVAHEQMPQMLSDADVCVFPSRWENFPTVCLEAMAAARGIVGSKFGGMSEMLADTQHGLLVDPFQYDDLAAALIRMIEHPAERVAMGQAARERICTHYSADTVMAKQEDVYRMAIQRRAANPRPSREPTPAERDTACLV